MKLEVLWTLHYCFKPFETFFFMAGCDQQKLYKTKGLLRPSQKGWGSFFSGGQLYYLRRYSSLIESIYFSWYILENVPASLSAWNLLIVSETRSMCACMCIILQNSSFWSFTV